LVSAQSAILSMDLGSVCQVVAADFRPRRTAGAGPSANKGKLAGDDERDWTASPRESITDNPEVDNGSPHDRFLSVLASGQRVGAMWSALGEVLLGSRTTARKGHGGLRNKVASIWKFRRLF
jgi:hypothetical protein